MTETNSIHRIKVFFKEKSVYIFCRYITLNFCFQFANNALGLKNSVITLSFKGSSKKKENDVESGFSERLRSDSILVQKKSNFRIQQKMKIEGQKCPKVEFFSTSKICFSRTPCSKVC